MKWGFISGPDEYGNYLATYDPNVTPFEKAFQCRYVINMKEALLEANPYIIPDENGNVDLSLYDKINPINLDDLKWNIITN